MNTDDLDPRLSALEARVPVDAGPPTLAEPRRRRRSALALVAAPLLVLAIAATAIAGPGVIRMITTSSSGTLDIDDAIANAGLECMTPPEAAKWLAAHGYDDVVWDTNAGHGTIDLGPAASDLPVIEPGASLPAGEAGSNPGTIAPKPDGSRSTTPPAEGVVLPGPTIDGRLIMFVDITPGAERPPTCPAAAMP